MKTSDPRHLLLAGLIGFATAVPVILGIQGCADREPVKPVVVVPEVKPVKPDAVVYVHEQRDGSVPPAVGAMLDKLNRAGIKATAIDDDITDGDDEVPEQYKAAIDAARLAGLPAFALLSKGEFLDFADLADLEKLLEELK